MPSDLQPVVPLGTYVRAKLEAWEEGRQGFDPDIGPDVPGLDGQPRFVEGPLDGFSVDNRGYFKHIVNGHDVDPATVRPVDPETAGTGALRWDDDALNWPNEPARRRRYRLLQSWYRENILAVPPGVHSSGKPLGSLLPQWAADEGLNFLHKGIHDYVQERIPQVKKEKGTIAVPRLKSNMLSSMPLAFNLFGQMREYFNPTRIALDEVAGIKVTEIERIEVEYAPQPVDRYLSDRTAFDGYIQYRNGTKRGFVGIETKYTEPFTRTVFTKPRYTELATVANGFPDGALQRLSGSATNQLLRNTLLAVVLRDIDGLDEAHVVVMACGNDKTAGAAVDGLRSECGEDGIVRPLVTFEKFLKPFEEFTGTDGWAREFAQRYLDLTPVNERS